MKKKKIYFLTFSCILVFLCSCNNDSQRDYATEVVGALELLPSEKTGIDFNNAIKESKTFNHYFYSQIYVGSGVAIGDINNDGLSDVFFGGNQVADKLYLNKGDLQFEDLVMSSN